MNLFTKPMRLLTAVVLEQKSDEVVKSLLALGVMDFVHLDTLDPKQMEKLSFRPSFVTRSALEDMRHRIEMVLRQGGRSVPQAEKLDVEALHKPDMESYRRLLDTIAVKLDQLKQAQRACNQELLGLEEMQRYIAEARYSYLDLRVGHPGRGDMDELAGKLASFGAVVVPSSSDAKMHVSLTLRRDAAQVNPLMDKFDWIESSDASLQRSALSDASAAIDKEMKDAKGRRDEVQAKVSAVISANEKALDDAWTNLKLNELCDQIRSYFSYTRNTTLFSGWVPSERSEEVHKAIFKASDGQCVIEWTEADCVPRSDVPVQVTSPKAMLPFSRIVQNYGTPEYGSVNPTPFVMVAYLSMFALMFADVGQGLVLLLYAIYSLWHYKRNPQLKDGMISRGTSELLLWLGFASMVGGALFGSCFGFSLFPAIWFNFDAVVNGEAPQGSAISDVYGILGVTIKFGIIVIYTGLVLNWINLFRKKAWLALILDKNGLIGGLLFAIGLYLGFGFASSGYRSFPSNPIVMPVIAISLCLLFARGFIGYFLSVREGGTKKSGSQVCMDSFMEWLVDVLEIFCGYMSNTLSFMRVAGLGIAHVCLMTSFYSLSRMVGGFGGVAIYVLGNVLVIVLEGLSAGIQALRLNYYEFFSRYFSGKGVAYEPVALK